MYKITKRYKKMANDNPEDLEVVETFLDWMHEQGYTIEDYGVSYTDYAYQNIMVEWDSEGFYAYDKKDNAWHKVHSLESMYELARQNKKIEFLTKSMLENLEDE